MRDRRGRQVGVSMGEATKNVSFWTCQIRCLSGGMCVRDCREGKVAVSLSHKNVFSLDVSEDVLMSVCVAGVALCDIRRV